MAHITDKNTPELPIWAKAVAVACSYDPQWLVDTLLEVETSTAGQDINPAVSRAIGIVIGIPAPYVVGQAIDSYAPRILAAINDPRNIARISEEERAWIIEAVTQRALTFLSGQVHELTNLIGSFEV